MPPMANFCILRTRKLKTPGNVGASLAHAFRARETPNADPRRTPDNEHMGAENVDQAMAKFRALTPPKFRKDAVRCIEYLVTYSPGALRDPMDQHKYFAAAMDWLRQRHGKGLFYAGVHTDEKTPHLYAYAVPLDDKGKLNCKSFLGGRDKLRAMQTEFHQAVGQSLGLDRGIRGSRATHQTLREFYGRAAALDEAIRPPKRKIMERDEDYAERYKGQIRPLVGKALEASRHQKRNAELETHYRQIKRGLQATAELFEGLSGEQRDRIVSTIRDYRNENSNQQAQTRREPRKTRSNDLER